MGAALDAADTAPTVMLSKGSSPSSGIPSLPVEPEHLLVTKDDSRISTLPKLPSAAGQRKWLVGGTIAGVVAILLVVIGIVWQSGAFSPRQEAKPMVSGGGPISPEKKSVEPNEKPKPKPPEPDKKPPTLEETLQAARKKAAEAYQDKRIAEVAPALEPVFQANKQNFGDLSLRGEARLALAESGNSPAENYRLAAADFAAGQLPWEQSKALSRLGKWQQQHEQPKQAVESLQESLKLQRGLGSSTIPDVQLQLCEAQLEAGNPEGALQGATEALPDLKLDENSHQAIAARLHSVASRACLALAASTSPGPAENRIYELDWLAEQHLLEAISLAERNSLPELAAWKNDLASLRKLPRMVAREEESKARVRIPVLAKELEKLPDDWSRLLEIAALEKKVGQDKSAAVHFGRGYALQAIEQANNGKFDEAAKSATQAAQHDADAPVVQYAQAVVTINQGEDQKALAFLDAALKGMTEDAAERWQLLATRGRALSRIAVGEKTHKAWERARTDFSAAIAKFPNAAALKAEVTATPVTPAHRELARLYFDHGTALEGELGLEPDSDLLDQADKSLTEAANLDPSEPRYSLAAGRSLLRHMKAAAPGGSAKLLEDASKMVTQALDLDPKLAAAHDVQGECLLLKNQFAAAQVAFEKAVEYGEKEPLAVRFQYQLNLSLAYLRAPRNDAKALAAAERAVALQAKDPSGHFARGLALRNLNRKPEAVAAFDEALTHQPRHVDSLLAKSHLIVDNETSTQRQLDQANKDIQTAFDAAANDAQKGEAYYVRSMASLKFYLAHATDPAAAEPALLMTQRDLLQALTFMPANGIYAKAAADLFDFAATYTWSDAQRKAESEKLQAEWKKKKKAGGGK